MSLRLIGWAWVLGICACGPTVDEGSSEANGGADTEAQPSDCESPQILIQPGPAAQASGFEQCEDDQIHRVQAVACDPGGFVAGNCQDTSGNSECSADSECIDAQGAAGLCLDGGEPRADCACNFGCDSDADCGEQEACFCDAASTRCIPAGCRTDADCGDGQQCGLAEVIGACGTVSRRLACTSSDDECRTDADCDACLQCLPQGTDGPWTCSGSTGVCGPCG